MSLGGTVSALLELFRTNPVESCLFLLGPVVIALVQLLNSFVNDLSLAVSVPFAVSILAFSWLLARYQLAQQRLAELESETVAPVAD